MKKRYYILALMLSLLCINKTYAACTREEINEFNKIKSQYKLTPEFNVDTKLYSLTIERENPNMYDYSFEIIELTGEYDSSNKMECLNPNDKISTCVNFPSGSYRVKIVGQTSTCNDVFEETVIELDKYNEYYGDPLCDGIEEFVLCQPTYGKEIDYETFASRVNTYKKTKQKELDEQPQQNSNILDKVVEYVKENLIQIIIVIVFIILITISTIVMYKSAKKSRWLE